jgi:hypothetical protein
LVTISKLPSFLRTFAKTRLWNSSIIKTISQHFLKL